MIAAPILARNPRLSHGVRNDSPVPVTYPEPELAAFGDAMPNAIWRPMTETDLPAVDRIAGRIHAALPEHVDIFAERLRLYPDGCCVLAVDGVTVGYILSHPWHFGQPPALNSLLGHIPVDADTYYIHDLALLPEARRTGAGSAIAGCLAAHAAQRGLPSLSLIAVYDAAPFWTRLGFEMHDDPALTGKLAGYGGEARMMVRRTS